MERWDERMNNFVTEQWLLVKWIFKLESDSHFETEKVLDNNESFILI